MMGIFKRHRSQPKAVDQRKGESVRDGLWRVARPAFDHVATDAIPIHVADRLGKYYQDGAFDLIFPAAGASLPPLFLLGRSRQMECLTKAGNSNFGVLLVGPAGNGKTTLLNAFSKGFEGEGGLVARMSGRECLQSVGHFINSLVRSCLPGDAAQAIRREARWFNMHSLAMEMVVEHTGRPLLLAIDDVHAADPKTLARVLSIVRHFLQLKDIPVTFVMAGTPDVYDVFRDNAFWRVADWFLFYADDGVLLSMSNDLPLSECVRTMEGTLGFAGVKVADRMDMETAVKACMGSPKRFQMLGRAALASARDNDNVADFRPGGELVTAFQQAVEGEFDALFDQLDVQGLTGCGLQLGALWRACGEADDDSTPRISDALVWYAIESGLRCAPASIRGDSVSTNDQARRALRHHGLLWNPSNDYMEGPWIPGIPGFLEHVEKKFLDPHNRRHHEALPRLRADRGRWLDKPKLAAVQE